MKKVTSIVAAVAFTVGMFATQAEKVLDFDFSIENMLACGLCDYKAIDDSIACGLCDYKAINELIACGLCDYKLTESPSKLA